MGKSKLQVNVIGRVSAEKVTACNDMIRCNICIDGRICAFWTTEANYEALVFDGFFLRGGNRPDASGVLNTTHIYVAEEQCNDNEKGGKQ